MSGNYLSFLKKRSMKKTLAIAVTAGILAGGYSTAFAADAAQTAAEKTYNKTLTGVYNSDKATYKDVLAENNGQYNFGEGAKVTIDAGDVLALDFDKNNGVNENIVLSAKNGSITLKSASKSNSATQIVAASITHTGNFTIDAADTNITASSNNKAYAATGFIVQGSDRNGKTNVNIKGNLNINASGAAPDSFSNVAGLLVKGDAVLNVDGNVVMKDENGSWGIKDGDKSGYANSAGIKVGFDDTTLKGATLNVKGTTDIVVDGSGVVAEQLGTINLNGDVKIKTNKDSGKVAYGVAATYGGVANVNMNQDGNGAGTNTVNIDGNIGVIKGWNPNATVNIGLSNDQSTLHGVVVNTTTGKYLGQANMYMSNNALWTNESYGAVDKGFTGSNVGKFVGGQDASKAGFILQKDNRQLNIGNYSGHTVLVYEHSNDGSEASHFAAGDTHIKNAAAGSGIVMSTDNNGIDVNNQDLVKKVLNNLAGKLYYEAYVTGEKNLSGKVQIASGLTGSSISKELTGQMAFSDSNGQGSVVEGTIKPAIPEHQTTTDFTTSITGDRTTDDLYVKSGVLKENGEYVFEKNSNINIANSEAGSGITAKGNVVVKAEGSTLNINSKGKFGIDNTTGYSNKNNPYTVTITADKFNVSHENAEGRAEGIHIMNSYSKNDQTDKVAKVVINGDTSINSYGVDYTIGAYIVGNSILEINGNVAMKGQGDKQWGIDNDGTSANGYHSISGLYAGATYYPNQAGGRIVVNGNVDLAVNGTGVLANGNGSSVVINGGGTILTNKDNKDVHYALAAENGSVSMNMNKDNTAAGTNKVDIKGNIGVLKGAANENDTTKDTILNLGLSTADSVLTGVAVNNFTKEQLEAGNKPQLNMFISNGATWNNEAYGKVVEGFKGSMVDKLVGGADKVHAGVIVQKDVNKLSIGNYSGHSYLVYEHINDGTNASDFTAGDTHIKNAATSSGITMVTDNTNIDVNDYDQVSKVLNNLAGKLYYEAYVTGEKNLTGKVQISSGLTGSAISQDLASGDMDFSEATGQGNVVGETIKPQPKPEPPIPGPGKPEGPQLPDNISNGDYETLMMYGARAAMVDSMVAWRDTTAESFVRADELHKGAEEGAWVRINRGKVDYSGAGTEINGNFYGVQTGFDKSMGDGWTAGLMFDYRDGDSDYKMGSEGEHKLYGMGIYGTKDLGSNDYIDVVAKFGKVENDFTARNETGKELSGEYSAAAYSMSAQYGKRFEDSNGGYFEPQAQLTWSHVNSDTYDAHCGDQVMNIDQTAFDSFVGRLGVQAGQITDNGQAYVRLSIAHEFAGDIDGVYLANDGGLKTTQYNAGDTWSELNIGGSYKLSKCANFYADITKTLTGDYKQDWKFNAGMSFSF